MAEKIDIYKRSDIYNSEEQRLAKSSISETNKALIKNSCRDRMAEGISDLRIA